MAASKRLEREDHDAVHPDPAGQGRRIKLDPELAAINVMIPHFDLSDLPTARELESQLARQARVRTAGVTARDFTITASGGHSIAVRVYRPAAATVQLPAVFFIHGGGFMLGGLHTEDERCEIYSALADCVLINVDYRLAPEHPFPAAFDDCVDVLQWVGDNALELGIDSRRLAVGGNSAGGALAAALALRSRTEGPPLSHQFLVNPVLDHRNETRSARTFTDTPVWSRSDNLLMWESYLGENPGPIDYRASPALAEDVEGSPALWMWLAELDPLRDEGLDYIRRMLDAGVQVAFQHYPGTFHGFDSYRVTELGQQAVADHVRALRRAFGR